MDTDLLVTRRIEDGERLARRFGELFPLTAAFWLKSDEDEPWYLYLASDLLGEETLDHGYGEILRLSHAGEGGGIDPFQVKLVPSSHPLALAVESINRSYPADIVAQAAGRNLGGRIVEGSYIYPTSLPGEPG